MTKRRKILLTVSIVLLTGLLGALYYHTREPSYAGKSLRQWLKLCDGTQTRETINQAEDAIRHIGVRAVPFLIKWIEYEAQGNEFDRKRFNPYAGYGFRALGSQAKEAIPDLTRLMNDPERSHNAQFQAISALVYIGKDALPSLISGLRNQDAITCSYVASMVHYLGKDALPAAPAMLPLLNNTNLVVRNAVTNALLKLDPEALNRATQN